MPAPTAAQPPASATQAYRALASNLLSAVPNAISNFLNEETQKHPKRFLIASGATILFFATDALSSISSLFSPRIASTSSYSEPKIGDKITEEVSKTAAKIILRTGAAAGKGIVAALQSNLYETAYQTLTTTQDRLQQNFQNFIPHATDPARLSLLLHNLDCLADERCAKQVRDLNAASNSYSALSILLPIALVSASIGIASYAYNKYCASNPSVSTEPSKDPIANTEKPLSNEA